MHICRCSIRTWAVFYVVRLTICSLWLDLGRPERQRGATEVRVSTREVGEATKVREAMCVCAHVALVLIWARTCLWSHSDRVHGKCNRCVTAVAESVFVFWARAPRPSDQAGGGPLTERSISLRPTPGWQHT